MEAHSLCLSSEGIIMVWNKYLHTLSSFTLNGTLITKKQLPPSSTIGCVEVSADGRSVMVGLNPSMENYGDSSNRHGLKSVESKSSDHELKTEDRLSLPWPSIYFFDVYSLKVG